MTDGTTDELDADALAMLDAFRAEEQIPADVHERVWTRVAADVEAPAKWSRRALMLSGLVAAAAVALLWMGERALRAVDEDVSASQAGYERAGAGSQGTAEPGARLPAIAKDRSTPKDATEPSPTPEPQATAPEPQAPAPEPEPREPTTPRPKPDRRGSASIEPPAPEPEPAPAPAPAPALGDTLAEENRLISQARADLIATHPDQALARLDEHARRFPSGVLAQERQALRAVALCEAGRDIEGKAQARTFLRAHPQAALAQRVRGACLE